MPAPQVYTAVVVEVPPETVSSTMEFQSYVSRLADHLRNCNGIKEVWRIGPHRLLVTTSFINNRGAVQRAVDDFSVMSAQR